MNARSHSNSYNHGYAIDCGLIILFNREQVYLFTSLSRKAKNIQSALDHTSVELENLVIDIELCSSLTNLLV